MAWIRSKEFYDYWEDKVDWFLGKHLEDIVVEGQENISNGRRVYVGNHKSDLDPLILGSRLRKLGQQLPVYAAGNNLLDIPILGDKLKQMGAMRIDRARGYSKGYFSRLQSSIDKLISEGEHLAFYIEGGRSRDGKMKKSKLGLAEIVINTQENTSEDITIQPVSISYEWVPESKHFGNLQAANDMMASRNWFYKIFGAIRYYANDFLALFGFLPLLFSVRPTGKAYLSFGKSIHVRDYTRLRRDERGAKLAQDIKHTIRMNYRNSGTERLAYTVRNAVKNKEDIDLPLSKELNKAATIFIRKKVMKSYKPLAVRDKKVLNYYANGYVDDNAKELYKLGAAYLEKKDYHKAEDFFKRAITKDPELKDKVGGLFDK